MSVEITYGEAVGAIDSLNPKEFIPNGEGGYNQVTRKSELSRAKGDIGEHVYYLKHDIRDACKAIDERTESFQDDLTELNKEILKARDAALELKEGKSDMTQEEVEALEKSAKSAKEKRKEITDELNKIFKETTVKIKLSKGKLHFSKIKEYVDSNELEALESFIDFKK